MGFSGPVAGCFITVARKAREIPELSRAIESRSLSTHKASRIVSVLTKENSGPLIEFAKVHSKREIDFEVARLSPKPVSRDVIKPVSGDTARVHSNLSTENLEMLERAKVIHAQNGLPDDHNAVMGRALNRYLDLIDPVRKAKRAIARKKRREAILEDGKIARCTNSVRNPACEKLGPAHCSDSVDRPVRKKLTAADKNAVFARDEGRCTHRGLDGKRCNSDRWIDVHHIIGVAQGGTNHPSNLTTLCSTHHDLAHQLCLPIDGLVTWLRSPRVAYG
jgi:5-methylcytosine-specific restriction endonuclease McrA